MRRSLRLYGFVQRMEALNRHGVAQVSKPAVSPTSKSAARFALVGAGFATLVPIVFSAAGNTTEKAPAIALASVSTLGYLGVLIGPPIIGFAAECLAFALPSGSSSGRV